MTPPEAPQERWDRLKVELRAYNAAEAAIWGDIDDGMVARYIVDECNPDEKRQVEEAAAKFPAVREAIEVVRSVMAEPLETSAADFVETVAAPSVPASEKQNRAGGTTPRESITVARDNVASASWQIPRSWLATAAAVCLLCAVTALIEFRLIQRQRDEISRLTAERDGVRKELDAIVQNGKPGILVPTSDQQQGAVEWLRVVKAFYDENLSDEENLESLEKHGGNDVRSKIAELRRLKPPPSAKEMIRELFRIWGGPNSR